MSKPSIVVEDLCVRFRPYVERKPTLRRTLVRRRVQQEVVALDQVSFTVSPGEALGVIGRNGAGKSTLMRCIAGTLRPNSGKAVVNGTTSTLLQLGVGFIPALTGRRNVYLGGLAAGMTKKEIDERYDDIVDYAELGDSMDRPMNTYSSGMFSRLAFSVAMHLDPDVLLLDEILAVGDAGFQEKSIGSMRHLLDRAGTIVFVSHSLSSVEEFCDRAIWLDAGRIASEGLSTDVVASYRRSIKPPMSN